MDKEEGVRRYWEAKEREQSRQQWLLPILAAHDEVATVLTNQGTFGDGLLVVMRDGSAFEVSCRDRDSHAYGLEVGH
jgi:hypothetical protein